MKKFFVFGLSLALLVACLAGCAASPRAENAASDKGYYEGVYDSVESTEAERPGENAAGLQNQKLIRTVSVEAETDDLDASLSTLASRISAMGGYVEDQTSPIKEAYFTHNGVKTVIEPYGDGLVGNFNIVLQSGENVIEIFVKDSAGNVNTYSETITI